MQDEMTAELKARDPEAFHMLIKAYRGYLYKTIYAILRNDKDAEDALQETFIKIFYALPQYEAQGLKTWITRIAVNHSIDMKRKRLKQREDAADQVLAELPSTMEAVEVSVFKSLQKERLQARLDKLPDNYREVIQAFYLEEKTHKEIAAEQQVEVKTVEIKLYRARSWIRKHWKEDDF